MRQAVCTQATGTQHNLRAVRVDISDATRSGLQRHIRDSETSMRLTRCQKYPCRCEKLGNHIVCGAEVDMEVPGMLDHPRPRL